MKLGVPEGLERKTAEILYDSLVGKFGPAMGPREKALSLMQLTFQNDLIFVALSDDEVVGIIGLEHGKREFIEPSFRDLWRVYGWRSFRVILYSSFLRTEHRANELLIGAIVVSPTHRGKGVGHLLLDAAVEYALSNSLEVIRLAVIEKNIDAKRFYEEFGFTVSKVENLPFPLNRIFDFKSAIEMTLKLEV